jgi:hypothetical protein
MSAISSYDEALDFFPGEKAKVGSKLLAALRPLWEAVAEGNAAAYRYRQLIAQGKTVDAASAQVFAEFYAAR